MRYRYVFTKLNQVLGGIDKNDKTCTDFNRRINAREASLLRSCELDNILTTAGQKKAL
jgi:hypothetical protein